MNATINLREYLDKGKDFIIPNYQRGYVWGKNKPGDALDSVSYMLESLKNGYNAQTEVFIQGVTVSEQDNIIILIDGQQRTTFFYLLLKSLNYKGKFRIRYEIRKESDDFLKNLTLNGDFRENSKEEYQDIYFFKKSLRIISANLKDYDKESFCEYILDKVKFLYIDIPIDKASCVFTMMNGNKAEMKTEELIKAELLRLASLTRNYNIGEKEMYAVEWDNNMLRSRYAREWDKWLQWWKRIDVRQFYKTENVMGLLITASMYACKQKFSFDGFRRMFLTKDLPIEAKQTFDKLRRLQKRFEDAFNNNKVYNQVGAILRISSNNKNFIEWYFCNETKPSDKSLEQYYKLSFLGLSHSEIIESLDLKNNEVIATKFEELYQELQNDNLYNEKPEVAFLLLLRLNIDEDNNQENGKGRKFDFSIWDRNDSRGRSLEHIYPKSKVYHIEKLENGDEVKINGNGDILSDLDDSYICRDQCYCIDKDGKSRITASEHSIGNLVLLYKDDNSSFNNSLFKEKKELFFKIPKDTNDKQVKAIFKSRHLLHTIYKFATSEWTGREIAINKQSTLDELRKYYEQE